MSQTRTWAANKGTTVREQRDGDGEGAGASARLYIGRYEGASPWLQYTSYLRFTTDWSGVKRLQSAVLNLYVDDRGGVLGATLGSSGTVYIKRLHADFSEGANSAFATADHTSAAVRGGAVKKAHNCDAFALVQVDITDIARVWAPNTVAGSAGGTTAEADSRNMGIQLYGDGSVGNHAAFFSEDASAYRPTITITYVEGPTIPDTPTALTPAGAVASISSFEGDFSDSRATDVLHKSHVQVYQTGAVKSGDADADDTIDVTAHGYKKGQEVWFHTLTGGTGLSLATAFYVRKVIDADSFTVQNKKGDLIDVSVAYSALTVAAPLYTVELGEGNAAILAGRFSHVPTRLNLQRNVTYQWRARVCDNEEQHSAFTSLVNFSITNTNPNPPVPMPTGQSFDTMAKPIFRGGTFTDPDVGDTLLAYQIQMSQYPSGDAHWLDDEFILWDTGQRYTSLDATSWETRYGGSAIDIGTYHWRARQWDNHHGVSDWAYANLTLTADFVDEANSSVNEIQMRPRTPWRIVIREMAYLAVGGALTGAAATEVLTTTSTHGLAVRQPVRFASLTGGTGLLVGTTYYVESVPSASTFTVSASSGGDLLGFTSNITAGSLTAVTTRGPGRVVAVLEDAKNTGASLMYNSPGEAHWTLGISHPQLSVIEPRQTHYAIEFRQGDGWREVYAGLVWDFDATATDVVFYGVDYLGLLDWAMDTRYKPASSEASAINPAHGGSKYTEQTIRDITIDQLTQTRYVNSPVKFITTGTIAIQLTDEVTVYSTYQPTLNFIVGLLDSHRAGSGKRTRISCQKTTAGGYEWIVQDDPGVARDNLRLRYGELVQGYRVIPFGNEWATSVAAVGRDKDGVKVRYVKQVAQGIDEAVWGRWMVAEFLDGVADGLDFIRRAKQSVAVRSRLGKKVALGLRSGSLQPRDGYDLLDKFPVDIEHGSVSTAAFGHNGYWVAVGITWQALERGDLNTTLTLQPFEAGSAPSADLLVSIPISTQKEWQIGWTPPPAVATSLYWLDQSTGKSYGRTDGGFIAEGITGDV